MVVKVETVCVLVTNKKEVEIPRVQVDTVGFDSLLSMQRISECFKWLHTQIYAHTHTGTLHTGAHTNTQ